MKMIYFHVIINFGIRKSNIIYCQLKNEASNLKAHLFNDFLSDNTNCPNCSGPLEDNNHFLNLFLKIFKLGDSVIVGGKVFHSLIVKRLKLS
jgi:hypothetical protein